MEEYTKLDALKKYCAENGFKLEIHSQNDIKVTVPHYHRVTGTSSLDEHAEIMLNTLMEKYPSVDG